ncbi:MAG: CapA family protein, partial [Muribaculaceae bacterium]|nr:CapA family protein [Muribaculaceae bacterium]
MSETILAIVMKLTLSMMESSEATLLFAGDAMMHQAQIEAARRCGGGSGYDYSECFSMVSSLVESADYAVVNLETPLGKSGFTGYPCFNAPVSYASALKDAGFDLFLTANNHTLDRRDKGLSYTIEALDSLEIPHVGTYLSPSSRNRAIPFIKDVKGFRIGFLNYTYGTNGISVQGDVVVDYIDRDKIARDVEATRSAGAEIVVAAMHWGEEYLLLPVRSQKSLADYLVSLGVD